MRGANGQGKTSLLEAVGWVATRPVVPRRPRRARSCARAPTQAIVRAEVVDGDRDAAARGRAPRRGPQPRSCATSSPCTRARDLLGLLRVTVFAPDDLALVKGGPAGRRDYLDDLLVMLAPRYDAARTDYERVLQQRNALLRGGVRDADARTTLDVFDEQLVRAAARARPRPAAAGRPAGARGRARPTRRSPATRRPVAARVRGGVGAGAARRATTPRTSRTLLRAALERRRRAEIDRGITLVGPHRDEWRFAIGGLDARTHASQGEQRTLALALRLAGHRVVARAHRDARRCCCSTTCSASSTRERAGRARRATCPPGQTLLTTAGAVPAGHRTPTAVLRVDAGRVVEDAA